MGIGWHNFGRKKGSVRQPGPPSLAANGSVVVVTTCVAGAGPSSHYAVRMIDASSGRPAAKAGLRLPGKIVMSTPNYWVRQRHAAVNGRGFLTANSIYCAGFGAGGQAYWLTTFMDPTGVPAKAGKEARVERTFFDAKQSIPPGYRTYGLRTTMLDLAWDGKRGLFVAQHFKHRGPSRKGGAGTPGDIDIWALFVDAKGKRLVDPSGTATVEADALKRKGPSVLLPEGCKVAPVKVATGTSTQAAPCAAAGPVGSFLVAWQEEQPGTDSRIVARLVGVR
jgi:hypothetical protein